MKLKRILAIETSCDETSAAVIDNGTELLSNVVASQIKSHQRFGGVVPEVASRHHVEQMTLIMEAALEEAGTSYEELDAIAVTEGPGLVGALLIGVNAAKAVAYAHKLPLIPVNHIIGHIYANQLVQPLCFPLLSLVVSGGHTELVYMKQAGQYEVIGETRDDAAGEAYDKVGRVLGVPYPGGKHIDEMAHQGKDTFHFPRAMMQDDTNDFSFSGLKSSFINTVHNAQQKGEVLDKNDLAASFQAAVVEVLVKKTIRCAKERKVKQIVLAGGVAANKGLRQALKEAVSEELAETELIIPPLSLCGDNAAMIGAAAFTESIDSDQLDLTLNAKPGLAL
ncbi:tRNA (adenosine(37)-N6)-threonylcarbamoyltransferase complex transferase subunit TsaD [Marinilactibacillus psychrotolerans]|uniref:tRNA N6-adenosine threonylcarbamoyltransferase n=1 Tax=Marinilactibacillus psychrotolerans TaxID=191770 RepID=A0AAV3WT05_9LACT|nr:tRNA (adenosine(37)-N6)-threonylcarbamoyltransferase complex transferase subunit TsaD [Marinilactibacillus psychrotolerans]GEL66681.1 tRNA N6-adenosine threonylcarbamoyltransferase [Marinilactibacillus psychrotolerans]GEQ35203.1 tRNA threonylcarbamoyladenosine modification protein TsaD [Marinilactibacillus psychrotolerans]SDD24549.1 N6-L-threonylcarbamoyladenine synthase [Marinilactibacillus psychrotolerans]